MTYQLPEGSVDHLLAAAHEAGQAIMEIYRTDFDVRRKNDASPVTEADEKSEAIVTRALRELTPDIPIVAEEAYAAGNRPDVSGGRFWLVDALDGTKEFVNKRDEFTVNAGLIDENVPVFGVIHAPALSTTYWGDERGVYRRDADGNVDRITSRAPAEDGLIVMTSRSHKEGEDEFLADYTIKGQKHAGSSIKFCLIACGEADFYPRLGPTSEWDIAAGHAILAAAGGSVCTMEGDPMIYGKSSNNYLNPHFIARGAMA